MAQLLQSVRNGRMACYWSKYTSTRRADFFGLQGIRPLSDPAWRVMRSQPYARYGVAGGRPGRKSNIKVHLVRDQVVAKHDRYPEQRLTRWLCGAYTFEAVLRQEATMICSACLFKAQHRTTEPLPKEKK